MTILVLLFLVLFSMQAAAACNANDGDSATRHSQGADARYRQLVSLLGKLAAESRRLRDLGQNEFYVLPLVIQISKQRDLLTV